jgi:hypothetical protein
VYWGLWRVGPPPDLRAFLASRPGLSPEEAAAVIGIDQLERWRLGQRILAEEYLPLLGDGPGLDQAAGDVVYGEFLLREQLGEQPDIAEYQLRFPDLAPLLQRQAEVHLAFTGPGQEGPAPTFVGRQPRFPEDDSPPKVPGYEVLDVLGRGGMGVVYRARQLSLGRLVALKVVRLRAGHGPEALERFRREAVLTAGLSHPGIVTIFDAGQAPGCCYFAMELVSGTDLGALVERAGPLDPALCLDYLRQAADALACAHAAGLVHRDIKPSNLMAVPSPEGRGHARVKLLDLGLARRAGLTAEEGLTEQGAFMGTPDFVAPEQAHDPRAASPASDLYSLGCTFFYAATGRTPYDGPTPLAKLMQHQAADVPLASQLRPGLPEPLVSVLARLMAKRPEDRFPSAIALLEALGQPPALPPPRATGPAVAYRLEMDGWVKAAAFSPDGSFLAAGGVGREARMYEASSGRLVWKRPLSATVLALAFSPEGGWLACALEDGAANFLDARTGASLGRAEGHSGQVNAVAFVGPERLATAGHDGEVRLWHVPSGQPAGSLAKHVGPAWAVTGAGKVLATAGQDRVLRAYGPGLDEAGRASLPAAATCAALSSDGSRILVGDASGGVSLLDSSCRLLSRREGHSSRVTGVAWAPSGGAFATCGRDGAVRAWPGPEGEPVLACAHEGWALCVAWSRGGMVASGGADERLLVCRVPLG